MLKGWLGYEAAEWVLTPMKISDNCINCTLWSAPGLYLILNPN